MRVGWIVLAWLAPASVSACCSSAARLDLASICLATPSVRPMCSSMDEWEERSWDPCRQRGGHAGGAINAAAHCCTALHRASSRTESQPASQRTAVAHSTVIPLCSAVVVSSRLAFLSRHRIAAQRIGRGSGISPRCRSAACPPRRQRAGHTCQAERMDSSRTHTEQGEEARDGRLGRDGTGRSGVGCGTEAQHKGPGARDATGRNTAHWRRMRV